MKYNLLLIKSDHSTYGSPNASYTLSFQRVDGNGKQYEAALIPQIYMSDPEAAEFSLNKVTLVRGVAHE